MKKPLFQKRYEKYGVAGYGNTITEAKADWEARVIAALDGDYHPYLMSFKEVQCLIWREKDGWVSINISPQDQNKKLYPCAYHNMPLDEIITSTRQHLAQLTWQPGDDLTEYIEYIADEGKARTFKSWVDFQYKYAELRAAGLSDFDAHRQACGM